MHHLFRALLCSAVILKLTYGAPRIVTYNLPDVAGAGDVRSFTLTLNDDTPQGEIFEMILMKIFHRQPRQYDYEYDEDDEDTTEAGTGVTTNPYAEILPAVFPSLQKLWNGLVKGSFTEVFHAATSFAPRNVSHNINTVFNSVVGLPAPTRTPPPPSTSEAVISVLNVTVASTTVADEDVDEDSDEDEDY